jgi:hypothetical protein
MAALAEAQFDQSALTGEYFRRQLAAVFPRHRAFDRLDDGRGDAAVIFELLGAISDLDTGTPANVFVVGALVRVLEPAPAAHVVDQNRFEPRGTAFDINQQLLQRIASVDAQAALAVVGVGPDDVEAVADGVLQYGVGLVLCRIALVLS